MLGVALWGLHMGLTQGLLATLVADTAPADLRGTAFGMFNLVTGIAMLVASVIAGALWDVVGPQGTFLAGARSLPRWRSRCCRSCGSRPVGGLTFAAPAAGSRCECQIQTPLKTYAC